MSAAPIEPQAVPQRIQSNLPTRDTSNDHIPFCWDYWSDGEPVYDDTVLHAYRPKQAVLLDALRVIAAMDEGEAAEKFDPETINFLYDFIGTVLDEPSAKYVNERLTDREDPRDIDPDLTVMITTLVGKWYGGPAPKAQAASQRPRSSTGKRSTGRSRSTASTRKR